jgi:hypothetical protein
MMAVLAAVALLFALTASSAVQGQQSGELKNVNPANMDTMYHAVVVTDMSSDSLAFNVLNSVVKNKDGSVLTKDLTPPMSVRYFYANDTVVHGGNGQAVSNEFQGYSSTDYDSATINVAGASAVIAGKGFNVSMRDGGMEFQVASFSAYMPDGTVKSYKLDTPIRATMSQDGKTMTAKGTPQLRAALQEIFSSGAKFPADAAPIKVKDIDARIR